MCTIVHFPNWIVRNNPNMTLDIILDTEDLFLVLHVSLSSTKIAPNTKHSSSIHFSQVSPQRRSLAILFVWVRGFVGVLLVSIVLETTEQFPNGLVNSIHCLHAALWQGVIKLLYLFTEEHFTIQFSNK